MNAHKLGRFVADFLGGFLDERIVDESAGVAPMPAVIPMDAIRQAVREVIEPLIAADEAAPPADELDNMFADANPAADPMGEAIRQRVADIHAREDERQRADLADEPPAYFDANSPNGKPWMAPAEPRA